jgi:hypothetical protein
MKKILKCRICEHDNNNEVVEIFKSRCIFLDKEELVRFKCNKCGVIYGTEKILNMSEEDLFSLYDKLYKTYSEGLSNNVQMYNLSLAYKHLQDYEQVVLNWGSGKFPISNQFNKKHNSNAIDYDIIKFNEYMITDLNLIKEESLGAIVSNNVLEHFQYPVEMFKKMNKMLKLNGFMVHSCPCIGESGYCYEYTRFHTFFYTGNSIEILAEKSGFEIVDSIKESSHGMSNVTHIVFKKIRRIIENG